MKRKKKTNSWANVLPIYIFVLAWLICSFFFPMYKMWGLVASFLISAVICGVSTAVLPRLIKTRSPEADDEPEELPRKARAQSRPAEKPLDP